VNSGNNTITRSLLLLALGVIAALTILAIWGPTDNTLVAVVITAVVGVLPLVGGFLITGRQVASLQVTADETHNLVNSRAEKMQEHINSLQKSLEQVRTTLAIERTATTIRKENE
jgi:parvulin-like peptidyl-prolyl isomerase